jgi:ribonucleotide reductase beta subunit family protein with ferritin-like domain
MNDTEILKLLCNFANKDIVDNQVVDSLRTTTDVNITKMKHNIDQDLYCVAVKGKAFVIRSNDKISVTGNTQHCEGLIKLFRTYVEENRELWNNETKEQIYSVCEKMVELEDKFVDLAYKMGPVKGLTSDEVKEYVRYIADRRLISMGMKGIYKVKTNPLPWVEEMINAPIHTNFFENKSTEYSKGALTGGWEDVWR